MSFKEISGFQRDTTSTYTVVSEMHRKMLKTRERAVTTIERCVSIGPYPPPNLCSLPPGSTQASNLGCLPRSLHPARLGSPRIL